VSQAVADSNFRSSLEEDISSHIFVALSAMLGVCLTVIGLLRVVIVIGKVDTLADDLLAIDSLLFFTSCLASYFALRTRSSRRMHRLERVVDRVFILAMLLMVVAAGTIASAS
jgi:hypothetical protein